MYLYSAQPALHKLDLEPVLKLVSSWRQQHDERSHTHKRHAAAVYNRRKFHNVYDPTCFVCVCVSVSI